MSGIRKECSVLSRIFCLLTWRIVGPFGGSDWGWVVFAVGIVFFAAERQIGPQVGLRAFKMGPREPSRATSNGKSRGQNRQTVVTLQPSGTPGGSWEPMEAPKRHQKAEPILKWLGGWVGPLQTIFRRRPINKWFGSLGKP